MPLIVQKFGGTSIANVDRIKSVANLVRDEAQKGNQVIVVVSAMAGVTNQLVGWSHQCIHHHLNAAEYDVVVSSGEQVTCGLMALALNDLGLKARSWLAWQIGLHTTDNYKNADITSIDKDEIQNSLNQGEIAVVSGFQGISSQNRLTTLGRGGSDYTAVALAAEFGAERCDIYTDVDGIYTADPRAITNAELIKELTYKDALSYALHGAKVLQAQAIERASYSQLPVRVLSSFHPNDGTVLSPSAEPKKSYIGVASRRDKALLTIKLAENKESEIAALQEDLKKAYVELDPMTSFQPLNNEIKILTSKDDFEIVESVVEQFKKKNKTVVDSITTHSRIAKVALIGKFRDNQSQLIKETIECMEDQDILIYHVAAEKDAVNFLMAPDQMEDMVKVLHEKYVSKQTTIKEVA